jgi:hypothetical protein
MNESHVGSDSAIKKNILIHVTLILLVVLYECENGSLALREEHRFLVAGNQC